MAVSKLYRHLSTRPGAARKRRLDDPLLKCQCLSMSIITLGIGCFSTALFFVDRNLEHFIDDVVENVIANFELVQHI
jgi:hypothetical protein